MADSPSGFEETPQARFDSQHEQLSLHAGLRRAKTLRASGEPRIALEYLAGYNDGDFRDKPRILGELARLRLHLALEIGDEERALAYSLAADGAGTDIPAGMRETLAKLALSRGDRAGFEHHLERSATIDAKSRLVGQDLASFARASEGMEPEDMLEAYLASSEAAYRALALEGYSRWFAPNLPFMRAVVDTHVERFGQTEEADFLKRRMEQLYGRKWDGSAPAAGPLEIARTDLCDSVAARSDVDAVLDAYDALLKKNPPLRDVLVETDHEETVVSPRMQERGAPLAIVFCGVRDQGHLPVSAIDTILAGSGVEALYLRDFRRRVFAQGVGALGGSMEETVRHLRETIDDRQPPEVVLIGFSAGGLAAFNYATPLNADRVVAFAAPTDVTLERLHEINDERAKFLQERTADTENVPYRTASSLFTGSGPKPPTAMFFDPGSRLDAHHTRHQKHQPFVSAYAIDYDGGHNVAAALLRTGDFQAALIGDHERFEAVRER